MYFVHSFYVEPQDTGIVTSMTRYGTIAFCASFQYRLICGCQFHPERSGPEGIKIYKAFKETIIENE